MDRLGEYTHDLVFFHNDEILAVELDLGTVPLAKEHAVSGFNIERNALAFIVDGTRADGDDFAFLWFFFSGVGNDDAAGGFSLQPRCA